MAMEICIKNKNKLSPLIVKKLNVKDKEYMKMRKDMCKHVYIISVNKNNLNNITLISNYCIIRQKRQKAYKQAKRYT